MWTGLSYRLFTENLLFLDLIVLIKDDKPILQNALTKVTAIPDFAYLNELAGGKPKDTSSQTNKSLLSESCTSTPIEAIRDRLCLYFLTRSIPIQRMQKAYSWAIIDSPYSFQTFFD